MLIIILMVIFVVYWCLSTKIVQTKQTHLVRAFFTKVSTVTHNYEKIKKGIVRGWSTLRDPICCIFFLCVPFLKDCLFLISSWDTGTSRAACSSQDWDHGKEHLLGFPSVTLFSDLLLKGLSILLQLVEFHSFWWFSNHFIEDIKTCVSTNKVPLLHSRLGSPASFFLLTPVPRSQSIKTMTELQFQHQFFQRIFRVDFL